MVPEGYEREWQTVFVTAWHVLSAEVKKPQDQIDITIRSLDGTVVVKSDEQALYVRYQQQEDNDIAVLSVQSHHCILEEEKLLAILPHKTVLRRGASIGWLGFPGLAGGELCFFSGHISGFLKTPQMYLVDGVAINGVSGGPAFDSFGNLIGLVSRYIPNVRRDGTMGTLTMPGLAGLCPINSVDKLLEDHGVERI